METPFTDNYDKGFLLDTMMGPNAMRVTEELTTFLSLSPGMRVLDLGCGKGISSILLAQKYDITVFAADLWISPTENAERFTSLGLDAKIVPLSVDATKEIPFAHEYFDIIISVDSYQYYGNNENMLPKLLPFLKKGGVIAIAVPGFIESYSAENIPVELQPFWAPDWNFYSREWWRTLWEKEPGISVTECREMDCCKLAWEEWLESPNPYAQGDIPMMEAGGWKYFNLIQMVGVKQ
ncbi:MAG: Trans-aconitate 2-methyltransferase [Desulfovibrio sp.]